MIEVIRQKLDERMTVDEKLNRTREFLQILCLKTMADKKHFARLAFVGGTSLRILFDLRRFSEDLDFSIHQARGYDLEKMKSDLEKSFELYGLPFETRLKKEGSVQYVMMKFTGLLNELGLSGIPGQKISIKLEIDTNPPAGWSLADTVVNKTYLFSVKHYDLPSLYAGKLHACFFRKFVKGRDFYDFVWYLGKKVTPNFKLLNESIKQTEKKDYGLGENNFKKFLMDSVGRLDLKAARSDVERFLEDKSELAVFDGEAICSTIEQVYGDKFK